MTQWLCRYDDGEPEYYLSDATIYDRDGHPRFYFDGAHVYSHVNGRAVFWLADEHLYAVTTGQPALYFAT
jgi:hypothetical protein